MRRFFPSLMIFYFTFGAVLHGQEVQVPMDKAGKIEYIDSSLEQKLFLFSEYENFREARLFQISDSTFVLEISYQPADRFLRVRNTLSAAEVEELRLSVTAKIEQTAPQAILDQTGRRSLIINSVLLSFGFYGWAVPVILEVDDGKSAFGLYMLTSGAGFFLPMNATKYRATTDANSILSIWGAKRGILHGIIGYFLIFGDREDESVRAIIAMGMLGSVSEGIYGFHYGSSPGMTAGTATAMGYGGDYGVLMASGMAHLINVDNARFVSGTLLLGTAAGLYFAESLAEKNNYTRGDAYVVWAATILGAYAPLAVVNLFEPEEDRFYTAASMIGSVLGLGVGDRLVRGRDFTFGEGFLINLGGVAGWLGGMGLAYLVSSDTGDNDLLFLASSAAGAAAGFWLTYKSFVPKSGEVNKEPSWNFSLAPEGLLLGAMDKMVEMPAGYALPALSLNIRF